jgi:hypothetical protein
MRLTEKYVTRSSIGLCKNQGIIVMYSRENYVIKLADNNADRNLLLQYFANHLIKYE